MSILTPEISTLTEFKGLGSAVRMKYVVQPENLSTYTSSDSVSDIFFAIPAVMNSFLDGAMSNLSFDINVPNGKTAALCNGSGSSVISAIEITHNGQQLEGLQEYGVMAAFLEDFQSKGRSGTISSILHGTSPTTIKTGYELPAALSGEPNVSATAVRIMIPIHAGLFSLSSQHFPLSLEGLRLRVSMAQSNRALVSTDSCTYTLSNINLNLETLKVSPAVFNELVQDASGVMKHHSTSFTNYQATMNAGSKNESILIPSRFSSQKSIISVFRPQTYTATASNSTGGRIFPNIVDYVYNISGVLYPSLKIKTGNKQVPKTGESMYELLKSIDGANNPSFDCVFNQAQYNANTPSVTGAFAIGYGFETSGGYGSMPNGLISGLSTVSSNSFLQMELHGFSDASTTPTVALINDNYVLHDLIIELNVSTGEVSVTK